MTDEELRRISEQLKGIREALWSLKSNVDQGLTKIELGLVYVLQELRKDGDAAMRTERMVGRSRR